MAISYTDPNAYTLMDHALNSNDPIVKETALVLIEASSLFTDIPMITKKTLKITGSRITGDFAEPSWVDINTPPQIIRDPDPEPWEEGVFVHRDGAQVDDLLLQDENAINDPFELKLRTKLIGFAHSLNYRLIQNKHTGVVNDPRVNKKCFVGFRERLDRPDLYFTSPDCKISASGVDLSLASATADDGIDMQYYLDALLDAMGSPDGTGITLAANGLFRRSFARASKKSGSGAFRTDKDNLGRTIEMYNNAKFIDAGRLAPVGPRSARTQAPIISTTETADGAADTGGNFTSVYAIRTGMEDLYGWQFGALKPGDPYLLPDGVTWQSNINGTVGIAMPNTRAIGRIFGIGVG